MQGVTGMLYKRGRTWWVKFKINGRTIRKSCGTSDRAAAAVESARLRVKEADSGRRGPGCRMSELAAADIYRAKNESTDPLWPKALSYYWRNVLTHFGADQDPETIGAHEVKAYIYARRAAGCRNQTIRRELQALRRGIALMLERGRIAHSLQVWPKLKSDPKGAQAGQWHDPALIAVWMRHLTPDARDRVIFAILTGLRSKELERVRAEWVESTSDDALCPAVLRMPETATKTRQPRSIPLAAQALEIVRRRAGERGLVFAKMSHRTTFRAAARRIGYSDTIHLRDLRHVFATLAEQHDRKATQDMMGHTTERMTGGYLHSDAARVAAVGAAVAKTIGDTISGAQAMSESELSSGGRSRSRTCDIQLVRLPTPSNDGSLRDSERTEALEESQGSTEDGAQGRGHKKGQSGGVR